VPKLEDESHPPIAPHGLALAHQNLSTFARRLSRQRWSSPDAPGGFFARLGPGLITGASDDDPSGIATYSQTGAQFGLSMAWVMLYCLPLMVAIQEISARIGRVTGQGVAGNLRAHYPRPLLLSMVTLLMIANIANLGADLGAMADSLLLLVPIPAQLGVVLFAVGCALLEVFVRYERYTAILKWLSFTLLAYVATTFAVHVDWRAVTIATLVPHLQTSKDYLLTIVAVLGTTITPYCFFWQSSEEAEDERVNPDASPLIDAPSQGPSEIARIRFDTIWGMSYSNLISLFIIITTAATLHAHGITDVATSAQAALALRPLAGEGAFLLFALGVIGIGLLAVPVLAGSAAYALGEALDWPTGLGRAPLDARAFYAAIAVATLAGIGINAVHIDPLKALFWSAVLNGIVAPPLMAVIMMIASRADIMGRFVLPWPLKFLGWTATGTMFVVVVALFAGMG
jgi:NRAMP (natural resistance-associated macrophage protein)-like metal ion transporter